MLRTPKFVYIAFDVFPSQKGAATHINHCLKALEASLGTGVLICLGTEEMPQFQYDTERNLYVYRWKKQIANFLQRTQAFQEDIAKLLASDWYSNIVLVQFRDIWGGIPTLKSLVQAKKIFEVNALPSIELPYRYPRILELTLRKIRSMEAQCIQHANCLITPSAVTRSYLMNHFNCTPESVIEISNGIQYYEATGCEIKSEAPYILYFGALQKWQGLKILFKAFKELSDLEVRLMICSSVSEKRATFQRELAESYGLANRIDWYYELDKATLAGKIRGALFTVAPLISCNRNILQGCNPLKVLESMSYGIPVLASNLPVVSAIIKDGETGFLVPPDRPERLGRAMRQLVEAPERLRQVGAKAAKLIANEYLWEIQEEKMQIVYNDLLISTPI